MNTIAEKIKYLRNELGLTQPELAQLVGVSNGTISFWENDLSSPRAESIKRLAEALKTTPEYLLSGVEENITQIQTSSQYTKDEQLLIEAYRAMTPGKKRALFQMLDLDKENLSKIKEEI